jgi:hypothetical protein
MLNIVTVEKTDVEFVIDKIVLESERVGFHPNVNTATVLFEPEKIKSILEHYGANYKFIDL